MYETAVRDEVLRVGASGAEWLGTGPSGGLRRADAGYNLSVPTGFDRTDLDAYVDERLGRAGFETGEDVGPALLTGVSMEHARGARAGDVVAFATAGLSNPAALPMDPGGAEAGSGEEATTARNVVTAADDGRERPRPDGTVNLLVGTTRPLDHGALAELLATVVEVKAATLLEATGVPGTTSDAAAVATEPVGEPASFCGSATEVGEAARACVREAVRSSLESRYPDGDLPEGPEEAEYGTVTTTRATVFQP